MEDLLNEEKKEGRNKGQCDYPSFELYLNTKTYRYIT